MTGKVQKWPLSIAAIGMALFFGVMVYASVKDNQSTQNSSMTASSSTLSDPTSYFFKYNGTPGSETDEALWENTTNPSAEECSGENDGCLIEVDAGFTGLNSSNERVLTQAVPVETLGSHLNPDESSDMIISASNKNP